MYSPLLKMDNLILKMDNLTKMLLNILGGRVRHRLGLGKNL